MSSGFNQLVSALEGRYDFLSARYIAREAISNAGLKEQDKYSDAELQKVADALSGIGSGLDAVYAAIGKAPSGEPVPAPAPAPAAEAKKDDAKADDKKADAKKDDKKADDKKADKKDDKKDDKKADAKKDDKKAAKKDG